MTRAEEGTQESQTDPRSSETRQEESDLISECKCHPRYQPRVPPWLRMPRMCGTNPEDLVRFPPLTFPSAWDSSPSISLFYAAAPVLPPVLNLVSSHHVHIQLPPMTFFSISLFSGSLSHPLMFPTLWLLAPSRPHFPCHSLASCFFFPLPPRSLSPSSIPLLPAVASVPPMHFPSSRSPSHPPPFPLPQFQHHANIGTAVKFICTSAADSAEPFRWGRDIDLGWSSATMATRGKGTLSYHLHLRSTVGGRVV